MTDTSNYLGWVWRSTSTLYCHVCFDSAVCLEHTCIQLYFTHINWTLTCYQQWLSVFITSSSGA